MKVIITHPSSITQSSVSHSIITQLTFSAKCCVCSVASEVGLHAPLMADWWLTGERLMSD